MAETPSVLSDRFSYTQFSANVNDPVQPTDYGEVPSAPKMIDAGKYPRDTLLDTLGAIFAATDGGRQSGVLEGFTASPSATVAGRINFTAGTALHYNAISGLTEAVIGRTEDCDLSAPHATLDRWDLICVIPAGADYNTADRPIVTGAGVLDTMSLPYSYREGMAFDVTEGTPHASPVKPTPGTYDVPVAYVLVQANAAPQIIDPGDVEDARVWVQLRPDLLTAAILELGANLPGLKSHATDTGVVTTTHTRTVVGATTSQASGANANVSGGVDNTASGSGAQVSGGEGNTASGVYAQTSGGTSNTASGSGAQVAGGASNIASGNYAQVAGGSQNIASANYSHIAGSFNCENATTYSLGMGYDAGAAIAPSGANQNLSIHLKANGGHAHFAGNVLVGGDVDAGTGQLFSVDGATGLISVNHDAPDACAFDAGTNWTVTKNIVSGLITVTNSANHALNTGDEMTVALTNNLITSSSAVIAIMAGNTTVRAVPVITAPAAGSCVFTLRNIGPNGDVGVAWGVAIRFVVIGAL